MSNSKIILYAEALTHIRQLTLHASLQTEKNEHTKILISSDKKIITALHDGESASIYLPTQISGTAHVTFPIEKRTEISTRLQIDDVGQLDSAKEEVNRVEVPWSAAGLQEDSSFYCGHCDACILPVTTAVTWKDLPSENWAELMDFWFCHKPHNSEASKNSAAEANGSFASKEVAASSGVGLVDTVSLLLYGEDCTNVEETNNTPKDGVFPLQCSSCKTRLGSCAEGAGNYRLYKSRLSAIPEPGNDPERHPAAVFLTAQLLSLIESSITRKVVVHADRQGEPGSLDAGLRLWIFNPDIYYSSSKRGPTAYRAMKVFYKSIPNPEEFLEGNEGVNHEELIVPGADFLDFRQTLQQSTDVLPDSARTFQDWTVGLLDRWERSATGSARMDENPLNKKVDEGFEPFKLPAGMQELYL